SVLRDEGGYRDLDVDGAQWVTSGHVFYSRDPNAPDAAFARRHFFLPQGAVDPFGNVARVTFDANDLLPSESRDALGNTVTAQNDYRVLQPVMLTDPNGNRIKVAFDALGLVAGSAVMGKTTESLGDSLCGFVPDLTPAQVDAFFGANDPHTLAPPLLGGASVR